MTTQTHQERLNELKQDQRTHERVTCDPLTCPICLEEMEAELRRDEERDAYAQWRADNRW